jgi:stage III sporulation protein AB
VSIGVIAWLGGGAVMIGTTALGRVSAEKYRRRPRELRQLAAMLRALSSDIQYAHTPLRDALRRASSQAGDCLELRELFQSASVHLEHPGSTGRIAISQAIQTHFSRTSLRDEDRDILVSLSHIIGVSGPLEQAGHLQAAVAELSAREREACLDREKYERVLQTLGVLAGVLIVIMLI